MLTFEFSINILHSRFYVHPEPFLKRYFCKVAG